MQTESAAPTAAEIARVEAEVGLSAEKKSKVAALLTEMNNESSMMDTTESSRP
jgi:hypothetical protein